MRILVIGGTGFIGLRVTRLLAEGGHRVTVLRRGHTPADLPQGVETLRDDFNDNAVDTKAWIVDNYGSATLAEKNNRIEMTTADGGGSRW